jgi:hypothetical protein
MNIPMDLNAILTLLYSELRRVDQAILALERLTPIQSGDMASPLKSAAGARPEVLKAEARQRFVAQ